MFQPPKSLIDAVRNQTLVPFIGAGLSVGAVHGLSPDQQFPDWNGLIRRLAKRLEVEQKGADAAQVIATLPDTMAAAQLAADSLGPRAFAKEMQAVFKHARPPGANLSTTHAIWRLMSPFLITTNYDLVLEWPWDSNDVQRIYNDDPFDLTDLDDASTAARRIWYLHGCIERVHTVILTAEQYKKLYPEGDQTRVAYQLAFNRFQDLLTTRSFLFVGFSLAEPVLRRKLQDVLDLTAHGAPIKFLLLKAGEADDAKKKDFFDNYNVQVIEFADFGEPMTAAIDAIGRAAWPDALAISRAGMTTEIQPLVDDLLKQITGLSLPPATISRIFNATKPAAWPHALTGGDGITLLAEAITRLGCALCPDAGGVPPLLEFADRLRSEASEPWLSRLQRWIDDALQHFAPDAPDRARLTQLLAATRSPAAPERMHVLVRIAPVATAPDQWLVHVWSWTGLNTAECLFGPEGRRFKQGSSADLVYDLVDELEARDANPETTSIAFLVPSLLACEAIPEWRLAESVAKGPPIGASYTVTVRPLERLDRTPLVRRRFKKAWGELKKRAAQILAVLDPNAAPSAAGVPAVLLDGTAALKRDLSATLEKQGVRCVVLREPPCATALGQLIAVLETTAPAILWYRDTSATPEHVETTMREILEAGPIADLPRRIRDERLEAFNDETGTHRGTHLTLIWDDTDYLPPEYDRDARAKIETI